jgi:choloylglycine hydrolase
MCTGIRLKGTDGTVVFGRTQEWGAFDLRSKVVIVPRNHEVTASMPEGKTGARWKSRYGFVGLNGQDEPFLLDGLNEKGLACGAFYLPGFTEFEAYTPEDVDRAIGPLEVVHYLLSLCSTIEETRQALGQIRVFSVAADELGFAPPLHYMVTETSGKSLVIEFTRGKLAMYDNPLGVITNAPPFDWHIINLRNYVNLSAVAVPPVKLEDLNLAPLGAGSGLLGLPGDFTPPSRFVRATAFTHTARLTEGGMDTVNEVLAEGSDVHSNDSLLGATQWTIAADTRNLVYYYHTQWNRRLRMVDLKAIDFDTGEIVVIPLDARREQDLEDITPGR